MRQRTVIWLIILRVVVITTLFFAALMFQSITEFALTLAPFFYITAATYALTILYILFLKFLPAKLNVYVQVLGDVLLITTIVYYSGGLGSSFSFLYIIDVITASILLYRRGGMIVASVSSITYGAIIDLQYYGLLKFLPLSDEMPVWSQGKIYYNLFINIIGFFTAALLTSIISENLRKTTEVLTATTTHLHDLQVFQHSILTSITSPLCIINKEGLIQYMNPAARDVFPGMTSIFELEQIEPKTLSALEDGEGFRIEAPISWKGRSYIPSGSPFQSADGKSQGCILIFEDVTELRKLEQELRRKEHIAAIGTMAAAIAHEIRNPLATITGSVQMLKKDEGLSEDERLYKIILEESTRLNRFIENFIRFVRSPEPHMEEFDIRRQVGELTHLLSTNPDWENMEVELKHPEEAVMILGDRDRIQQVFWNLLSNSRKALGVAPGKISIEITRQPGQVVVLFRDNAGGIDPSERERIFEPFTGSFARGLGLGLTLVKRYMQETGGSIEFDPSVPDGAGFILTFTPAERAVS